MNTIRVYNPTNEYTHHNRNYNMFFDSFTEFLKTKFNVEEHRFFENAHKDRMLVKLQKSNQDIPILECEYIIENMDNGEFVAMSVSDVSTPLMVNEITNPFFKKILISQYNPKEINHHNKVYDFKYIYKYTPWTYFPFSVLDLEPYYKKRLSKLPVEKKLYFRGTLTDRPILNYIDKDIIFYSSSIDINNYFDDLIKYDVALSIDGVSEFCYRDIECFAVGIPILRFEYESIMYDPLIPNYHYISIPRPNDMISYRLGTKQHANLIKQKFVEIIKQPSFLYYISINARKYYEKNCKIENIIRNTYNIINLDNWL